MIGDRQPLIPNLFPDAEQRRQQCPRGIGLLVQEWSEDRLDNPLGADRGLGTVSHPMN
jgi:hypothetical protein